MLQLATEAAAALLLEQRTWSAQSPIPATSSTPRSSSTTHQPLTAKRVWDEPVQVDAPPGKTSQLSPL